MLNRIQEMRSSYYILFLGLFSVFHLRPLRWRGRGETSHPPWIRMLLVTVWELSLCK